MSEGEALARRDLSVTQHFTEPPPRFSEASLVKRMEELGIGRPSTYASILQVLKDRGYVRLDKKRLHGEDKGRVVVAFLESFFTRYVEYDFTASLEEQLDRISNNEISWQQVLKDFWTDFIGAVDDIKDLRVAQVLDVLDAMLGPHIYPAREDGGDPRQCPSCGTGRLNLKAGKFGAFVGCSNYPECRYTRPLAADGDAGGDRVLGKDPQSGLEVAVKSGRFGPYIQLGEPKDYEEGEKPKRAGIPKGMSPGDMEFDLAIKLLSLPREVGKHPEDGEPIKAGIGRFGPYVQHIKTYASLEAGDDVFNIGLNRAVTLIAEKIAKGPSKRRFGSDPGKPLGDHPTLGGVAVKSGRYGAYVTAGGINATIPSDKTQDTITLAEAIALIDERAAKGGGKAKRPAKKAAKAKASSKADAAAKAPKKAVAKKAATKKAAAKPKSDATSKARAPVKAAKTSSTKAPKTVAKKSAGKSS
jgi:DNA topoisomerase-1